MSNGQQRPLLFFFALLFELFLWLALQSDEVAVVFLCRFSSGKCLGGRQKPLTRNGGPLSANNS